MHMTDFLQEHQKLVYHEIWLVFHGVPIIRISEPPNGSGGIQNPPTVTEIPPPQRVFDS